MVETFYGRTTDEWDVLVDATLKFLVDEAKLGRTTTYTELNTVLGNRTGLQRFDFDHEAERAAMGELLGRVVEKAQARYPGFENLMISSLVIYLNANDAGSGFYNLAQSKHLLQRGADRMEFWVHQVNAVHAYFRRG